MGPLWIPDFSGMTPTTTTSGTTVFCYDFNAPKPWSVSHPMITDSQRFERAIALFDAANGEDPRQDIGPDGTPCPRELLYSRRMTEMIERFAPEAPEAVKLAVALALWRATV